MATSAFPDAAPGTQAGVGPWVVYDGIRVGLIGFHLGTHGPIPGAVSITVTE
jgi:hypothetical protein